MIQEKGIFLVEEITRKNLEYAQFCSAKDIQPWLSDTIGHRKSLWRFVGKGEPMNDASFKKKYRIKSELVSAKDIIAGLEWIRSAHD